MDLLGPLGRRRRGRKRWGFFNRVSVEPDALVAEATAFKRAKLADGPAFAHSLTKAMLHQEWSMDLDTAIDAEATAQALCMLTEDFRPRVPARSRRSPSRSSRDAGDDRARAR